MRDRAPRSWPGVAADAETRAAQALRRLEDVTRLVSDWVWETGPDHRLIFVSERVFEILQVPTAQVLGKTLAELGLHDPKSLMPASGGAAAPQPFRDVPCQVEDAAGETRHLVMSGVPFFDNESGAFMGMRGTARDITDSVRVAQVKQAQEERQRAFVADVAHELRTPLAVFRTRLDTLPNDTARDDLRREVDGMTRILSQMLAFARYESLEIAVDTAVDLTDVATRVVTQLGPIAISEHRSIEMIVEEGAEQVRVPGDADALEQAVRNLVENAIRYSSRESIITVNIDRIPSIHVINHGRSIPGDQQKLIFDRFSRADRRGGGVGLGLSIVKRIAEAHGASVGLKDVDGGGCDFSLSW